MDRESETVSTSFEQSIGRCIMTILEKGSTHDMMAVTARGHNWRLFFFLIKVGSEAWRK